jgi:putative ATPase
MAPLADDLRPESLDEFEGQEQLIGEGKPLRKFIDRGVTPPSMLFWGPPGTGKTTLARIIASETDAAFTELSAVDAGKKELQKVVNKQRLTQSTVLLFLDEIHRFHKGQQDYLLPYVEDGTISLIGATTENPSFEVNNALLSRSQTYRFDPLANEAVVQIVINAADELGATVTEDAEEAMTTLADGDARRALNIVELAAEMQDEITGDIVETVAQESPLRYDKDGEEHYNLISALHKSMRDSDVQASVYWAVRMLKAGEDPKYVVRRMLRFASEDVGNADPKAIQVAVAAKEAVTFVGMPEAKTAIVQLAAYLAEAPNSNAAYEAVKRAEQVIEETGALPVPKIIRNAPMDFMKEEGYGEGYTYAHDDADGAAEQQHLPDDLQNTTFFED